MNAPFRTSASKTFAALSVPNFRTYIAGQLVSLTGTWMQMTAQSWLVLTLTHSATRVGVTLALQTLPVLFLAPYGGVLADRLDKRRLLVFLQCAMSIQALTLGLLTILHVVRFWEIAALALILGVNNAFENPSRQAIMQELAGAKHVRNAVSLYAIAINLARVFGPAVSGLLIASEGTGICFLLNAASFIAVIFSLTRLDLRGSGSNLAPTRRGGSLREGLRYVRETPGLAVPLVMMALVGCLSEEFPVSLPYMADRGLHVGSSGYGFMTAAMAVGAVIGGLAVASRGGGGTWGIVIWSVWLGLAMVFASLAPDLIIEMVALAFVGTGMVGFVSSTIAVLQLRSAPDMRGRVMSLWTVCFQGSTPIGAPLIGVTMAAFGARTGLGVGAVAALVAAAGGAVALRSMGVSRRPSSTPAQ